MSVERHDLLNVSVYRIQCVKRTIKLQIMN